MKIYQKFLRLGISLDSIGIETRSDETPYFCTPKGASIIGWAGTDGIHYCFIRGFGETVFAVSPMNIAPDYVRPLAETFSDFLRLLLACGDAAVLDQAWMWDKAQFETFLKENPATVEQKKTLSEIAEKMKLTAIELPFEYIKSLQSSFDYSKIRYTEEYYDIDMNPASKPASQEWKVYFEGNFRGHNGKDHAGKEIPIGKQFDWAGHHWLIPAAYSCSKGLVADFCMRVEPEEIRAFMEKWNQSPENGSRESLTQEQQMEMELDNPMYFSFKPQLEFNGRNMKTYHGCSVNFNPLIPEESSNEPEAKWVIEHYGLDTSYGWHIFRNAFKWESKLRPEIKTLSLKMEQQPKHIPGPHFITHAPGDSFSFIHPVSNTEYTLTVHKLEHQTIPKNSFGSDRWFYPTHFTAMSYTLSPETSEHITVSDCDDGDKPIENAETNDLFTPEVSKGADFIGIVGGADGPTVIAFGGSLQSNLHAACSALHFEPVRHDIEWRINFREKLYEELEVNLLEM
ncbi:MAG: hypothetical protein PUE85_10255 [Firmicutes bacterium]|nr:hypothetical protein [Bacillota bacterium]